VQKTTHFYTHFLTGCNPPFLRLNSHITGRKSYANVRYWMAKLMGAGGVARSVGKEHLFWGKDREILRRWPT